MNFDNWLIRAAVVTGLTWAAYKYLPAGSVFRMGAVAVGALSLTSIIGAQVPLVASLIQGRLPLNGTPAA